MRDAAKSKEGEDLDRPLNFVAKWYRLRPKGVASITFTGGRKARKKRFVLVDESNQQCCCPPEEQSPLQRKAFFTWVANNSHSQYRKQTPKYQTRNVENEHRACPSLPTEPPKPTAVYLLLRFLTGILRSADGTDHELRSNRQMRQKREFHKRRGKSALKRRFQIVTF